MKRAGKPARPQIKRRRKGLEIQYYRTLSGGGLTPEEEAAARADYDRQLEGWREAQRRGFEGVVGAGVEATARGTLEHFGIIEPAPGIGPQAPFVRLGDPGWELRPPDEHRVKTEADAVLVDYAERILEALHMTRFWYGAVKGGSEYVGSLAYYAFGLGELVGQANFALQWGKSLLPVIGARERAAANKKQARERHVQREHEIAARLWLGDPRLTKSEVARHVKSRLQGSRTEKRIIADLPSSEDLLRGFPCVSRAGLPRRRHEWDRDEHCLFCEAVKAGEQPETSLTP